jgi:hypothetical protein
MQKMLRVLPWLPALLVIAVYLPALTSSFQFDDWQVVLGDARVASVSAWWSSMPGMRALTKLSFALNRETDAVATAFRAVNILLHAVNASLVFFFIRRLARRLRTADESGAIVIAAVTALVFALHPVQTESVTYIAARSNALATSFCLLALLAWLRGREAGTGWWWMLIVALLYVAALASKETAAVLPLAMLLCLAAERTRTRRELVVPLALCALCVVLFVLAWPHLPYDYLLRTSLAVRGPLENLAVQAQGVSWLAGQLVLWSRLNADPMLLPIDALSAQALGQGAMLMVLLVAGIVGLRRWPAVAFGVLWFFLWLAPTNSLIARLDIANDRQLYVAIIGPAWLLAHGIAGLRLPAWMIALPLALLLCLGTANRNAVYATEQSFWQDVVAKSPHNARAWNNLGMAEAIACQADAARDSFMEASRRDAKFVQPQVNLALLERGELPGVPAECALR